MAKHDQERGGWDSRTGKSSSSKSSSSKSSSSKSSSSKSSPNRSAADNPAGRKFAPGKAERDKPWRQPRGPQKPEGQAKRPQPWRRDAREDDGTAIVYGWHAVKAALANPARKFRRLLATENALHRLTEAGIALPIEPQLVKPEDIASQLGPDAVHQGLLAEAEALAPLAIEDYEPADITLVFDQITDPHNVGAILRSAAAFAVGAVVTTARHSPEMTGVLAKAASGGLEYVPVITVGNLARALDVLKKKNVFVVGLDSDGDADLASVPIRKPLVLVLGAEGKGLRHLTRQNCDALAKLSLPGAIKSLNVSNATALALYVASTRLAI